MTLITGYSKHNALAHKQVQLITLEELPAKDCAIKDSVSVNSSVRHGYWLIKMQRLYVLPTNFVVGVKEVRIFPPKSWA